MPETKLHSQSLQQDGWEQIQSSLTYASATTINSSVDLTGVIQKGDKIKLTQTTAKYFYVTAITSSLITVTGGTDYTVANAAITVPYFSKIENPQGFPHSFSLGTPTWTTSLAAFTNQPGSNAWYLTISGNMCTVHGLALTNATSGGTGVFFCTFTTGYLPTVTDASGSSFNLSDSFGGFCYTQASINNQIRMAKYDGSALAGNSKYFEARVTYKF